jgi:hypothetical protein
MRPAAGAGGKRNNRSFYFTSFSIPVICISSKTPRISGSILSHGAGIPCSGEAGHGSNHACARIL